MSYSNIPSAYSEHATYDPPKLSKFLKYPVSNMTYTSLASPFGLEMCDDKSDVEMFGMHCHQLLVHKIKAREVGSPNKREKVNAYTGFFDTLYQKNHGYMESFLNEALSMYTVYIRLLSIMVLLMLMHGSRHS